MNQFTIESKNIPKIEKVFFPGINALRFFAALGVIITHIELLKGMFGYENYWEEPFIFNLGGLGVYFFFVLSGFLITFLLLKEKAIIGEIKIKQFYLRRILRIWPLYYLICVLGFFILPHLSFINIPYLQKDFELNFTGNLFLYILILPNLAFSLFPAVPHIGQLWSIGVEEQFYLAWPWIIDKSKNVLKTLMLITVLVILVKVLILFIGFFNPDNSWYKPLKLFVAMSKFECMSIGGIGAYYLFTNNERILKLIFHPFILLLSLLLIPLLVYYTPAQLQDGIHIVFSIIFLVIILNVSSGKKLLLNLENVLFSYLGKISYGLYMYHLIVIPLVITLFKFLKMPPVGWLNNTLLYLVVVIASVIVSGASYALFEYRFIKLKGKFALIKSGDTFEATKAD